MIYLIESNKTKRKIVRVLLFLLGLGCLILASMITWLILILGLYLLIMVVLIKDLQLIIYSDKFEIKHVSIISRLSSIEVFYYKDIQKVKFDKGFTNIVGALIDPGGIANTTNSKPDTIEVTLKDGSWRSISRIGPKSDFYEASKSLFDEISKFRSSANRQAHFANTR